MMLIMTNTDNHYTADKGKTFRRKEDGFVMGNDMYLYNYIDGTPDKIENYEEIDDPNYTEDTSITKIRRNRYGD